MPIEDKKAASRPADKKRKDRLIQTRVPSDLETTLKEEAKRRRLTVSHLIRNILEDTFDLVDSVVSDAEEIVSDSVRLAKTMRLGAQRMASATRGEQPDAKEEASDLSHVYAWNEVVLHKPVSCTRCGTEIATGERGFTGLSDDRDQPRAWLCPRCIDEL